MLCGLWKLPFRYHGAIKVTQNCVCLSIHVSIPLFRLLSLVNTTPRYLNVSNCCSVFPLTCRIHCLGCFERHNTSILLVLIFVPACSHAAENRSNACWRPCWEDPHMQYQFVRKKQTVNPAVPNSDTLVDAPVTVCPIHIDQGSSNFFGEDHISYCTTVRGLDILRNVIFSAYVTFYQINTFLVNTLFFHYWQNVFSAGWNGFAGPILARGP